MKPRQKRENRLNPAQTGDLLSLLTCLIFFLLYFSLENVLYIYIYYIGTFVGNIQIHVSRFEIKLMNNERETWIIYIYIYFRTKVVILLIIKHIRVSRMNLKRNIAAELDKILTGLEIKNKATRIIIFFKGNVIRVEINVILNKVATFSQSNFCIAVGRTYRNATDNNKAREWNKYATNRTWCNETIASNR